MGKKNIDYEVRLTYDEEKKCIRYNEFKITLYDAFQLVTPMSNHTPENLEVLLQMLPRMTAFQLDKLLYCCASRFCCSGTNDNDPSPLFTLHSHDYWPDERKELHQLYLWGCLDFTETEKPQDPRHMIFWPSKVYHLDWSFLKTLHVAGYGPLKLKEIRTMEYKEFGIKNRHGNYFLHLDNENEAISLYTAWKLYFSDEEYRTEKNKGHINKMFPQLSEFQFNILSFYLFAKFNKREEQYSGKLLIDSIPPMDMPREKKANEIARMNFYGILHASDLIQDVEQHNYELCDSFIKTLHEKSEEYTIEADCQVGQVIFPDELRKETLFYNSDVLQSLEEIKDYLQRDNFNKLQKHFQKEMGHLCFACLLEGPSGTGKTAFVKELARCTCRPIIFVDIAKLRHSEYGKEEKMARAIFDDYIFLSCQFPIQPILFVDECDTMLCSRGNPSGNINSSLVNCQNTVTEIWLQELDKFDGILFLTTNHASYIDDAIARRLLFQTNIGHPEQEIQVRLWQHFFSSMSESEAKEMAVATNFTGGQIRKVKEKVKLKEILYGQVPFNELKGICLTNGKIQKRTPVGFGR